MTLHQLPDVDGQIAQGSHEDTAYDSDAPPAYDTAVNLPATASTPPKTTSDPKGSDEAPVQHGETPAPMTLCSTFAKYGDGWGTLDLRMRSDFTSPHPEHRALPWEAVLAVKCQDVPRLMRDGFFWSVDNVLPEEGYMTHTSMVKPEWRAQGYHHIRTWFLIDKSNGESPQWVARLQVFATTSELLPRFRVQTLSRDNVCSATAWDAHGRTVYNYDWGWEDSSYNCIYDDKPLQGAHPRRRQRKQGR
ncbi:hypothetical protein C8A00DRAFT_37008 [Chaetomidium leptoderma]|uniref:Uncharacterized protein n=1 Tax=Chaetomidium leptoderma TaxID=669021 RepID=A0AAN6VFK5_9PEZI|nr:hypothetical protein C8A00DRAFT_37008 [Chaetomidium leptoderma]